jgi:hypothetical protein
LLVRRKQLLGRLIDVELSIRGVLRGFCLKIDLVTRKGLCITRSHSPMPCKSGARVGIVDAFRPTSAHGTPPNLLRCELAAVGYREISFDRLTGSDTYLGIFAPPSVASRTRPEAMVGCKAP